MRDKIYEIHLHHPLTVARRKLLIKYLEENADRVPWKIHYQWEEEAKTLHLKTNVVKWEMIFHGKTVQVHGSGPFWARMLFTDQLREKLRLGILEVFREVGLLDRTKSPKPKLKPKK